MWGYLFCRLECTTSPFAQGSRHSPQPQLYYYYLFTFLILTLSHQNVNLRCRWPAKTRYRR